MTLKQQLPETIQVRPKMPGFFLVYVLTTLPGIFISFLVIVFLIVAIAGAASSFEQTADTGDLILTTKSDASGDDAILIYDLEGTIYSGDTFSRSNGIYVDLVADEIEDIKNNSDIKGVVVRLNTPGGTVVGSQKLGDLFVDLFRSKDQDPVFYYDELVASGGVWASQAVGKNTVYASPYGQTGSIGVVLSLPNLSGLAEKVGYSETVFKSSASKDFGNPLREVSEDERAFIQGQVDDTYDEFVDVVATGRELSRDKVIESANGFVYMNDEAKEFGLVDELGDVNKAVEKVAQIKGLKDYDVLTVEAPSSPFAWLEARVDIFDSLKPKAKPFELEPGITYAVDTYRI